MRTSIRTVMAVAVSVPLAVAAVPASASTSNFRERDAFADVFFQGAGTPGGLPGNFSSGQLTFHGSDSADGYLTTYFCGKGETPWGDESGENACDFAGAFYAWGDDVSVTKGRGKAAATTFTGAVDLYEESEEGEGAVAAEDVPFTVTLAPSGRKSRSTSTESFRDPETGESFRVRQTVVFRPASASGSVDGIPAVDGVVGTYSLLWLEHTA